jgi:8-oxo-dGTP diphosphatase
MTPDDLATHLERLKKDEIAKVVVGAVLVNSKNAILLVKRAADDFFGGFWEFPSGNVERGEDLLSAVQRELLEEAGIDLTPADFEDVVNYMDYFAKDGVTKKRQINFFARVPDTTMVTLSSEHTDFAWFEPASSIEIDEVLVEQIAEINAWIERRST